MPSSSLHGPGASIGRRPSHARLATGVAGLRHLLLWWPLWLALAAVVAGLVAAYQVPRQYSIGVGTPSDQAYVLNFHPRLDDNGRPYRWSDVYGYVRFPGLGGSRPFTMDITLDPGRTAPVTLIVNGVTFVRSTLNSGWQTISLRVDSRHPSALASRDTVLEVRAPDYRAPDSPAEPKGVKISEVDLRQDTAGGFIQPPYVRLVLFATGLLLLYLFVGLALWGFASEGRARLWALLLMMLAGGVLVAFMLGNHVAVSAIAWHLNFTIATMVGALLVIGRLLSKPGTPGYAARLLGVCVAVAFGLRFGGMALPQSVITDMPWHMKWLTTLLSGDWQSLYFPGGLSSVPAEWGLNLLIPKSPLFYFAAAPLGIVPFDLETLVKWLICGLDASVVVAVFWFVLRLGTGYKAAIFASALCAVMPLAFRSFSYGILPTIFAQWLSTLVFVAALGLAGRKLTFTAALGFTLLTCLALIAFPTVAVFVSMVLVGIAVAWWVLERRRKVSSLVGIPAMLVVAWALAIVAYYGLYISPVLASAAALLEPKPGQPTTVRWPGGLPDLLAWTADYVVSVLPALLALIGLALLFAVGTGRLAQKRARWLILVWAAIAPIFLLVNLRMDMIGKHLFFTMAPFAVVGGVALWSLARRGRWAGVLVSLALTVVAWQGLVFWIDRLLRTSS